MLLLLSDDHGLRPVIADSTTSAPALARAAVSGVSDVAATPANSGVAVAGTIDTTADAAVASDITSEGDGTTDVTSDGDAAARAAVGKSPDVTCYTWDFDEATSTDPLSAAAGADDVSGGEPALEVMPCVSCGSTGDGPQLLPCAHATCAACQSRLLFPSPGWFAVVT